MRLNADIIYQHLRKIYPVEMRGARSPRLLLSQPEFYFDYTERFESNHVYLATADRLPQRPIIGSNVVLVCIGDSPRLGYYSEHATVLIIRKQVDYYRVFSSLQSIFVMFDEWESMLLKSLLDNPSVQSLLDCSVALFHRPLYVLDSSYSYVAAAVCDDDGMGQGQPPREAMGRLGSSEYGAYLETMELNIEKCGALHLDLADMKVLCVNLFDKNGRYIGCLYVNGGLEAFSKGDDAIAEHLADVIMRLHEIRPMVMSDDGSSLRHLARTLMSEQPLSSSQRAVMNASDVPCHFLTLHYLDQGSQVPVHYLCALLEEALPGSVFFERDNSILSLVEAGSLGDDPVSGLAGRISDLLSDMHLCMGVSSSFNDLRMIRSYYLQAEAALENGLISQPGLGIYWFKDYALMEMVSNCFGNLAPETYYPEGLTRLIAHDAESRTSYLETLRVLLECNLSYTQAARRLDVHRSTLIERADRINRILGMDLDDPDQRLLLQILLKHMA